MRNLVIFLLVKRHMYSSGQIPRFLEHIVDISKESYKSPIFIEVCRYFTYGLFQLLYRLFIFKQASSILLL